MPSVSKDGAARPACVLLRRLGMLAPANDLDHLLISAPNCDASCRHRTRASECAFQIAWEINPHMKVGTVDSRHAARQHGVLRQLVEEVGAAVSLLPFVHGAFDSVFIKDNALLVSDANGSKRALLARPRHPQRAAEQRARHAALMAHGFCVDGAGSAPFEGGDVVVLPGSRGALLGTGFRSEPSAATFLERFLDVPAQALELRDPLLYHLDTACFALRDGTVAFCPEAFTPTSVRWFERNVPVESLIRVSSVDARHFALNVVEVGHHVILGGRSSALEAELRSRGWVVHTPDLEQFRFAGGSAACLVAPVHRLRAARAATTRHAA